MSTIMDCEDSVAAVEDAKDKVVAYGNWLGLMRAICSETFEKGGQAGERATMNDDRDYSRPDGSNADA